MCFDVVIVDDMPEFTTNIKKLLEMDSLKLRVFSEPEAFLDYSKNKEFATCKVIVVDYSMPNLSGYDVYEQLYNIRKGHINLKKILYSANLEQISNPEKQYLNSLGVELLKKPNIKELVKMILDEVNK